MQKLQRGVGWFGFLIVVAIAVAVGYYAYKGIWLADEQQPSCEGALNACIRECRRTASEADEERRGAPRDRGAPGAAQGCSCARTSPPLCWAVCTLT
jgi:hypothetical protein